MRTRLLSLSILLVANASARVTDSGRPSGIATATRLTEVRKRFKKVLPFWSFESFFMEPCVILTKNSISTTTK